MKDISDKELRERLLAVQGKLGHLKTHTSHRRHTWEHDLHRVGDPFIRCSSAILPSKAWRRMSKKTQVASPSFAAHGRDRSVHVGEVIAHSQRLADYLGLNIHLASAIAAGHDIGHVPFGHQGEHYLQQRLGTKAITHELLGVMIAQHVERGGQGLNLTHATLDGMFRHSGSNESPDMTPEARIVRTADKIAYLFADYNDFRRMRWPCSPELIGLMDWFGDNQRRRTFMTMLFVCEESVAAGGVAFETSEAALKFREIRRLMYKEYERVVEQDVSRWLDPIYDLLDRSGKIPAWLGIALMTDEDVYSLVGGQRMLCWKNLMDTGLGEIIGDLCPEKMAQLGNFELDLDW